MPVSKKEISPCPIDAALSVIDGRWKGTILWHLATGPMRTSELRREIPEITQRMLIRHLHDLVRDGILVRIRDTAIRSTRYRISDYGETLVPLLESLCTWGRVHLQRQVSGPPERTDHALWLRSPVSRPADPPSTP